MSRRYNRYGNYEQIHVSDYVKNIIDTKLKKTFTINGISLVSGNTYRVSVSSTKFLVENTFVDITGATDFAGVYQVANVIKDTSFDITYTGTGTAFTSANYALKILYKHGTYKRIYQDLERETIDNRTAVICLIESFDTQVDISFNNRAYKLPRARFVFCTPYKLEWKREDFNTFALTPLANLVDLLVNYSGISTYTEREHTEYGRFNVFKGYQAHLLGRVSAIEIYNTDLQIDINYKICLT